MLADVSFFTRIDASGNRVTWSSFHSDYGSYTWMPASVGIEGGSPEQIYGEGVLMAANGGVTFGDPAGESLLFTDVGNNYEVNHEAPCGGTDSGKEILVRQTPVAWSGPATLGQATALYCEDGTFFSDPALSPNGQTIAAVAGNGAAQSNQIVTIPISGGVTGGSVQSPATQITPANSGDEFPDFSPEGNEIAFQGPGNTIYTVPASGGTPTEILTNASVPAWSPYPPGGAGSTGGSGSAGGGVGVGGAGGTSGAAVAHLGLVRAATQGASVVITCSAGSAGCSDTVELILRETLHGSQVVAEAAGRTKHRTVVVGSRTVSVSAGGSTTVTVTLNHTGKQLLAKFHKLTVLLSMLQGKSPVGTHNVTIATPKHKH
jgi:hypothetical protein